MTSVDDAAASTAASVSDDGPCDEFEGLPVYRPWTVPEGLATKSQLNSSGLMRTRNQPVVAYSRWYRYGWGMSPLYRRVDARAKPKASEAQLAALKRGRWLRTAWLCYDCGELVGETPSPYDEDYGTCISCLRHAAASREAAASVLAPAPAGSHVAFTTGGVQEWAARLVALGGDLVTLDTETTDLHRWVVDAAVCGLDGHPLFSSLVSPGAPLVPAAVRIHKITEEMLIGAPTFDDVLRDLGRAIDGKTVVVYNVEYDVRCLARELHRHARRAGLAGGEAIEYARTWLGRATWVDLMEPYAEWYGEWHSYWGSYTWQRLPYGDHRAVGDGAGAARLLRELAAGTAPRLPEDARGPREWSYEDDRYDRRW